MGYYLLFFKSGFRDQIEKKNNDNWNLITQSYIHTKSNVICALNL